MPPGTIWSVVSGRRSSMAEVEWNVSWEWCEPRGEEDDMGNHGERFLLLGAMLITFRLRGQEYSVFESASRAGHGGPPPHRHLRQDEGFYVLEGQFVFHVEGQTIQASAGHFVNVPKGSVHTYQTTGAGVCRLLVIVAPAGIADFASALSEFSP